MHAPRALSVCAGGGQTSPPSPAPPTTQAARLGLTAGRGRREKGRGGRLPGSRQRKARGAPFSRTPINCSSASARGVPHRDPRRQKRLGRRSRPCKVQKRQMLSASNPKAHALLPASSGTLGPGAGSEKPPPGAPWEAGPGARREAGVPSRGGGRLWCPRRRFRGSSGGGGGTGKALPRPGPLKPLHRAACRAPPARGTKEPLPRRVRSPRGPADGSALRAPEPQLDPTGLRALCPRRGGKDGRTLHITDGARAPKPSPEWAPPAPLSALRGTPFIHRGRRQPAGLTLLLTSTALQS